MISSEQKFLIYARAIVVNSAQQILMLQKKENQKIAPGRWLLPGGTIEFAELPEVGLNRELFEEINFNFHSSKLQGTDTRIIENTHWLGLFYKVEGDIEKIFNKEPDKHNEVRWCGLDFLKVHLSVNEYTYVLSSLNL